MLQNTYGRASIEMIIIFPVIIAFFLLIFYAGYLYTQKAAIQSIADVACDKASSFWYADSNDLLINYLDKKDIESFSLYKELYDSEKDKKINLVTDYVYNKLMSQKVIKDRNQAQVNVELKSKLIILKEVKINIIKRNMIKRSLINNIIKFNDHFSIQVESSKRIVSAPDFIRGTDFAIDSFEEYQKKLFSDEKSVLEYMRPIKDGISKFFSKKSERGLLR